MDAAIISECQAYVGRRREVTDAMAPEAAKKLAHLLGREAPAATLPPTWHWAYFNHGYPVADAGEDGHERLGLFLPPAPFSRRMWAAGDVAVHRPLRLGVAATRRSTITDVAFKTGRTGDLCFVTVRHAFEQEGGPAIDEIQTIVYRDRGPAEKPLRDESEPVPEGHFVHGDLELYFYSALTHNGHRIHWDRAFCRDVEGYPGLVVHGPLMATKLCDAMLSSAVQPHARPCRFAFRALAPVFETTPVRLCFETEGAERQGRVERCDGIAAIAATLTLG
ncbi:FAS1-like dehydratase domain-containing protein [Jiella sonneratiae]|uniref:MaoC family dehydratase N-terminal domain-containing protein n=1 Tax=Jiella sonneratiae TaxID=2816856 RepID=A0ABS3IXQ0_9HYPH|nr:MaoC family dehydratase N-terminal domain-containing protein [Jiella sonneratiae]MBO0902169.1 MaoC family dehydratase N-terminal domain-containing protein [Jiella sonneratiae]